jgi:PAS domain S-box-containing protein
MARRFRPNRGPGYTLPEMSASGPGHSAVPGPDSVIAAARNPWGWRLASLLAVVAVLATDALTQRGFAHAMFYIPCVLLAALTEERPWLLGVTLGCVVLATIGLALSPPAPVGFPLWQVIGNRLGSVLIMVGAAAFAWYHLGLKVRMTDTQSRLAHTSASLRRQNALIEMASSVAHMGAWSLDVGTGQVDWSDETARIHGEAPGFRPVLDTALDFYLPDDRPRITAAVEACLHTGGGFDLEAQIIVRDGRPRWVRSVGRAVRAGNGAVVAIEGAFMDIHEAKRAQEELRESHDAFVHLAEAMPLIVWSATPDGRMDFFNQALLDQTGSRREELTEHAGVDPIVHPDDRARLRAEWRQARRSGRPVALATRMRDRAGGYRWHMIQAEPVRDAEGSIVRWYGSGADIHERTMLAERAEALARRLSATLESITDAFLLLDDQWRVVFMNTCAEHLLDRRREDLLNTDIWEQFPEAAGSEFERRYRLAVQTGQPVEFEAPFEPLDKFFLVKAIPSNEGLALYFHDITARRESEKQLRLLETAVARIDDIILITEAGTIDGDGPKIVFVNDAFERHTGWRRDEVLGRTPRLLQGPGTQREELVRIREALQEYRPVSAQLLNYRKDGAELWLDLSITPIADRSGTLTHFVAVQRDITQSRNLEQQRRQSQHLESIGRLTGGVAHDFNNLLTVILGNAELIPSRAPDDSELLGLASMVTTAAEKGAAMIQRLLAFARQQPLEPRSVDVGALVSGMDGLLRRVLGAHIQISLARAPGLWPAQIDPGQLESALLNLCINARDAMADGGVLSIEASNVELDAGYAGTQGDLQPGRYVMVAVSDTGCGIPRDKLGRVFEPFYSTKNAIGGTGLGLSMVYGFVKQSRGHVAIYSEPGQGTTVRMYLPQADVAAVAEVAAAACEPVARGQETILMVEDDNLVRRFVHHQLSGLGYRVLVASSGPEALPIIRSEAAIDLLFTDVVMPGGMTGRQLADAARAIRPGLRVLFTTGFTENAIVHQGRLDADARLLSKPYRRVDLARRIRDSLDEVV